MSVQSPLAFVSSLALRDACGFFAMQIDSFTFHGEDCGSLELRIPIRNELARLISSDFNSANFTDSTAVR